MLRKVLKDKEGEINDVKDQLCQAKEDAIQEYRDSDAFLKELGSSFADGFDDCFRQVKASFPDLDLSHIPINPRPRLQPKPSTLKVPTSCLMTPSLTPKVKRRQLPQIKPPSLG